MRAMLPTNAVPNWSATVTGLSPDLVGILGNRNIGTTAYAAGPHTPCFRTVHCTSSTQAPLTAWKHTACTSQVR